MDFNLLVEACIRGDLLCPLHIAKFSVRLLRILGCVRTSNALLNKQKIASCYNCEKDSSLCKWNPIKLSSVTLELVTQRVWVLLINQCIHLLLRTPWPVQERTLLIPADRVESMCTFGQPYDWDSRSFSKCGLCIRWRIRHMLRVFFLFSTADDFLHLPSSSLNRVISCKWQPISGQMNEQSQFPDVKDLGNSDRNGLCYTQIHYTLVQSPFLIRKHSLPVSVPVENRCTHSALLPERDPIAA